MNRVTITLPDELDQMISSHVESGSYASKSEVVREALRSWENTDDNAVRVELIKARIRHSIENSEPARSSAVALSEIEDHFATRREKI